MIDTPNTKDLVHNDQGCKFLGHVPERCLEPNWRSSTSLRKGEVSPVLASWLLEPGSITLRLRHCSHQQFSVNKRFQGWGQVRVSEAERLDIPSREQAIIREVELLCDGDIWVSARSVFPASALRGKGLRLQLLGNKSLGDILYNDQTLQRPILEVARLSPGHGDYHRATQHLSVLPDCLWARRSIYILYGKPILVSEVFLNEVS